LAREGGRFTNLTPIVKHTLPNYSLGFRIHLHSNFGHPALEMSELPLVQL